MILFEDDSSPHLMASTEDQTGLAWPRTWSGAYLMVMVCFVIWVALLVVLERAFP